MLFATLWILNFGWRPIGFTDAEVAKVSANYTRVMRLVIDCIK